MFIPSHSIASSRLVAFDLSLAQDNGSTSDKLRQWSSVIGIVTAIVGNILISFALNLQRYAHIQIDREYTESQTEWKKGHHKSSSGSRGYGTNQQKDANRQNMSQRHERNGASKDGHAANSEHLDDVGQKRLPDEEAQPFHERRPSKNSLRSDSTLTSDSDQQSRKSYLSSPYWWVGIILMTIGEAGNFLAYGFAPASIVSPLGVVALVSNCIIAPVIMKERFRFRDALGVLVAIAGAVVVVLSAKSSEMKMGPDMLWANIKRWEFLVYVLLTAVAILTLMWASNKYGEKSILIDLGVVGLFGGYTALATKGVASLVSDTLWRALTFPITYVCVVILIGSALSQIRYINRALQRFDSTQVIPTQFVLFTISVIMGSAVLYRDFESAGADRVGKFIGGCLLTFLGVYLITSKRATNNNEEDSSPASSPERIRLLNNEAEEDRPRLRRLRTSSSAVNKRPHLQTEAPYSFEGRRKRSPQPLITSPPTASSDKKEVSHQQPIQSRPIRRRTSISTSGSLTTSSSSGSQTSPIPPPSPFTNAKKTPYPLSAANPWLSSTDRLVETPLSHHPNNSNLPTPYRPSPRALLPQTPKRNPYLRSTQSSMDVQPSTPPLRGSLPNVLLRSPSGPADPETPVNPADQSRGDSPPKVVESAPTPPSLVSRKSIQRLMPGPLLSPLSGGLSAVVADSLRKGEGSIRRNLTHRRTRSPGPWPGRKPLVRGSVSDEVVSRPGFVDGYSREGSGVADDEREENEHDEHVRSDGGSGDDNADDGARGRGRMRSMSETFGGLVGKGKGGGGGGSQKRRKKKRRVRKEGEESSGSRKAVREQAHS
ncbi:MAG: hypothetical protein Q9160_006620 [Pyrenula sp. 1 TL-2023]